MEIYLQNGFVYDFYVIGIVYIAEPKRIQIKLNALSVFIGNAHYFQFHLANHCTNRNLFHRTRFNYPTKKKKKFFIQTKSCIVPIAYNFVGSNGFIMEITR